MSRQTLERHQVWIYVVAITFGLLTGTGLGETAERLELALWPALGLLLLITFLQVPLVQLPAALRDRRFMGAVLTGNFVAIPLLVGALLWMLPDDPALRLGVLMVLLVPCTDWYITFTHLSGGDTGRAIAVTPVNLVVQIALLPLYLWLFMGNSFREIFAAGPIVTAFVTLILLPLLVAWLLERWAMRQPGRAGALSALGWLPVPLLGLVVFLIAASQVGTVIGALPLLGSVTVVFVAFLMLAVVLGLGVARGLNLPPGQTRALVFSYGTRNSFVVLPLALALPAQWQTATVVIVYQSLIELLGILVLLWLLPRLIRRA